MLDIKEVVPVTFWFGPTAGKGELKPEPSEGYDRLVRSVARCPWHKGSMPTLIVEHAEQTFSCAGCGAKGKLVSDDDCGTILLERDREELSVVVARAMRKAYTLGQQYWQRADSESYSMNAKADLTQAEFEQLIRDTIAEVGNGERG